MRYFIVALIFVINAVKFSTGSSPDRGIGEPSDDPKERLKRKILAKRFKRQNNCVIAPEYLKDDLRMESAKSKLTMSGICRQTTDEETGTPILYFKNGYDRVGNSATRNRNKDLKTTFDILSTSNIVAKLRSNMPSTIEIMSKSKKNEGSNSEQVNSEERINQISTIRNLFGRIHSEPTKLMHSRDLSNILEKFKPYEDNTDLPSLNPNKQSAKREKKKNKKKEAKKKMTERPL